MFKIEFYFFIILFIFAYSMEIKQISVKIAKKNNLNRSILSNLIKKQKLKSNKKITLRTRKLENFLIKNSNYLEIFKFQNKNKEFIKQLLTIFENEEYSYNILYNKRELDTLMNMINIHVLESKCENKIDNFMYIDTWKCEVISKNDQSSEYSASCKCFYLYNCIDYEDFNYQYLSISTMMNKTISTMMNETIVENTLKEYVKSCEDRIFNLTQLEWNCEIENLRNEKENYIEQNCNCSREKFCEFQKIIQI